MSAYVDKDGASQVHDGSITQDSLAPNVAGNGPAFYLYSNLTGNLTQNAWNKVALAAKRGDTANACSDSKFTAPVAGWYSLKGSVEFIGSAGAGGMVGVAIYVNGGLYAFDMYQGTGVSPGTYPTSVDAPLSAGDSVELYGYSNANAPQFGGTGGDGRGTRLTGFLARAA